MQTIVSDTSCMIPLRKVALLDDMLRLPYRFAMPDMLFEDEWLSPPEQEKKALREGGLQVCALSEIAVTRAVAYSSRHERLGYNDCFALALAEELAGSILLTGDSLLRSIAEENGIEARGVLWIVDELEKHGIVPLHRLHDALRVFYDDDMIFLPKDEVARRIGRIEKHLRRFR